MSITSIEYTNTHAPFSSLSEITQLQIREVLNSAFPGSGDTRKPEGTLAFLRLAMLHIDDIPTFTSSIDGTVIGCGLVRRHSTGNLDTLEPFVVDRDFRNKFALPKKPKPRHGSSLLHYIFTTLQRRESPWKDQQYLQLLPVFGRESFFLKHLPSTTFDETTRLLTAAYGDEQ